MDILNVTVDSLASHAGIIDKNYGESQPDSVRSRMLKMQVSKADYTSGLYLQPPGTRSWGFFNANHDMSRCQFTSKLSMFVRC